MTEDKPFRNIQDYYALQAYAVAEPEEFWGNLATETLTWSQPFKTVLNESSPPFYKWFEGGKLNASEQCIDRHLPTSAGQQAIIWESEAGDIQTINYGDLSKSVNKFANLLADDLGIVAGDRVVLYMPMIPETIYAILACARIGAIHVVVFGGFSSDVLRDRIADTEAKLVITADGAHRRGKSYLLKPTVDEALRDTSTASCTNVLVVRHNNEAITMYGDRDLEYNQLVQAKSTKHQALQMDSEDPLFILHTSGSTGKPKGILHTTAGYLLWAAYTTKIVFDLSENDIFWCTADTGWITGHTYGIYGPLLNGSTLLMYEGVPTYPNIGRWWNIIERHQVTQFYTAPTALRMLKKVAPREPTNYNLSSLKVLGTVGEPIDPETWQWYHRFVGSGNCPIVDTWWQTETGGHMIAPIPNVTPLKPGSATLPLPGISVKILTNKGTDAAPGEKGYLCITWPWPSMLRTIWGDDSRYRTGYFSSIKDTQTGSYVYFSGDEAIYDKEGFITITGRVDDVMNISGHRIGSAEIESATAKHHAIAEVAIVSLPDPITGERAFAFIVPKPTYKDLDVDEIINEINALIAQDISAVIRLSALVIVPGLPKTRSGKVVRRALRSLALEEEITQDFSTLEDPDILSVLYQILKKRSAK